MLCISLDLTPFHPANITLSRWDKRLPSGNFPRTTKLSKYLFLLIFGLIYGPRLTSIEDHWPHL